MAAETADCVRLKGRRGTGHVLALGDGHEDAKLLERHRVTLREYLDQRQAEAGDEQEGTGGERKRLEAFALSLAKSVSSPIAASAIESRKLVKSDDLRLLQAQR